MSTNKSVDMQLNNSLVVKDDCQKMLGSKFIKTQF